MDSFVVKLYNLNLFEAMMQQFGIYHLFFVMATVSPSTDDIKTPYCSILIFPIFFTIQYVQPLHTKPFHNYQPFYCIFTPIFMTLFSQMNSAIFKNEHMILYSLHVCYDIMSVYNVKQILHIYFFLVNPF